MNRQAAAAELSAAQQTCTDQSNARVAACQRFGPAKYDPVIKPSNFVSGVNNPYFPLPPGTTYVYDLQEGTEATSTIDEVHDVWPHAA